MAAALARQVPDLAEAVAPQPVALLRMAALACRAGPRAPLVSGLTPEAGAETLAATLAAFLPQALDRRPVLWRPGAPGLSFDERWLAALFAALAAGDRDSERFLAGRRVRPRARWALRGLMLTLLRALDIS